MADNSGIEWTDATWNPLTGCTKISQGCKHCYAEVMAKRLAAMGQTAYQRVVDDKGHWNGMIETVESALDKPLLWKKPRMIFVNSMSDLFHVNVPVSYVQRVFEVMIKANQHTFQVLTKRTDRMADILNSSAWWAGTEPEARKHIWIGTSVEDQRAADERIPYLTTISAGVRFLSCEPLLGDVDITPHHNTHGTRPLEWVIVGGESGHNARPMKYEWAAALRDQCQQAGTAFFFKQWGEHNSEGLHVGKKSAGRLLDGREWNEFPVGKLEG